MISPELQKAKENAWSIENMAAHEAEGRDLEYIGYIDHGDYAFLFYKDSAGDYWYKTKLIVDEQLVDPETVIFKSQKGRKVKTDADKTFDSSQWREMLEMQWDSEETSA